MQNQDTGSLVIIGGTKGVGKTTIATELCRRQNLTYKHPGDWFKAYDKLESKVIEGMALHDILFTNEEMLMDLHYSVFIKSHGYIQTFSDESLKVIGANFNNISMFLITLPESLLLERRINDFEKERKLDLEIIRNDLLKNWEAFQHYKEVLEKEANVESNTIINLNFANSIEQIIEIINNFKIWY